MSVLKEYMNAHPEEFTELFEIKARSERIEAEIEELKKPHRALIAECKKKLKERQT